MREVMDGMAAGNQQPVFDALAEDVTWRWMGVEKWSHTFRGKAEVQGGLFGSVAETLEPGFSVQVHRILDAGEHVVVEHSGRNRTPDGREYNNNYCWVVRVEGGLIRELREYMDTRLVGETFGDDQLA